MTHSLLIVFPLWVFFFPWASKKILHERREKQRQSWGIQYLNTVAWFSLAVSSLTVTSLMQPSLSNPSPPPPSARGCTGCLSLETDCRQYVGIFHSEWMLIYSIEKKAFRNVSFVKIGWLLKRDREMLNVCMLASTLYFCSDLSFQKLKYRAL